MIPILPNDGSQHLIYLKILHLNVLRTKLKANTESPSPTIIEQITGTETMF